MKEGVNKMLSKKKVTKMAELFFSGKPEEAYKMVETMKEWDQFVNSIKKDENQLKAYEIMAKSDLRVWEAHTPFSGGPKLPFYDIGY